MATTIILVSIDSKQVGLEYEMSKSLVKLIEGKNIDPIVDYYEQFEDVSADQF